MVNGKIELTLLKNKLCQQKEKYQMDRIYMQIFEEIQEAIFENRQILANLFCKIYKISPQIIF